MRGAGNVALLVAMVSLPGLSVLPLRAQQPSQAARDLVRDVLYNELHDRERDSHWQYRSECHSATQNVVREQIETDDGPVFRIIEENGKPLDAAQRRREDRRLDEYVHDPAEILRVHREHEEDEARVSAVMQMLPSASLFEYQVSPDGETVHIAFRPDPSFVASGYEGRILQELNGTLTVNLRFKRLIAIRGVLAQSVDFGYGLLGHIEKGSWFEIHREPVSATHWKADLVEVHIDGKVLLFRTISRDQRETRTDFRPVPAGATVAQAEQWLKPESSRTEQAGIAAQEQGTTAGSAQRQAYSDH